ncbi:MAG: thermonuclease family protein [Candidatus Alcyoniella australis]|nr:thermonuclease family protein [Candidatus Alcyoniella australis]
MNKRTFLMGLVVLVFSTSVCLAADSTNTITAQVIRAVDGDTLEVLIDGHSEKVRLIGVDTPETVHPSKPVQYYGREASAFTHRMADGKTVRLELDQASAATGHRDHYGRLLAYVFLPDDTLLNAEIIKQGYGHAYTRFPFSRMEEFRALEREAREAGRGLWGPGGEAMPTPSPTPADRSCLIKGNINSRGEKIYHLPGMQYYAQTVIDESSGERWFCTEEEAIAAGWRKSKR